MKDISGGVTAARGFTAAGIHCGVKSSNPDKKDVALIVSAVPCAAAAVYTRNAVKAAPLAVTKAHLADGTARAILCNSGNANACAPKGQENAERMAAAAAHALGIAPEDVVVASTGVIGQTLNIGAIEAGVPALAAELSETGSGDAAAAIMTTDTVKKEVAVTFPLGGKTATLGGIAKGSGMIHPNMGTMLCFLTTDAAIAAAPLQKALYDTVQKTFNRVSVDGDTSTNDMCVVLANGLAGNDEIAGEGADYDAFCAALMEVCTWLARRIAGDGEGATKLITCSVSGARDEATAETLAMSVVGSSLVKAAMFGSDANWGRVLCAMGYSGAAFDPTQVDVAFRSVAGSVPVCQKGEGLPFDEELAKTVLQQSEVEICIDVHGGEGSAAAWGCDLTYDYVKINGDYRT